MQDLSVTIVQADLIWGDIDANLNNFSNLLDKLDADTDLIVLPEMFSTAFAVDNVNIAEGAEGEAFRWMNSTALKKNAAVVGSIFVKEGSSYYNRLVFMKPDGTYVTYDKRHLFRLAGEHEKFSPGDKRVIVDWKGWKILPLICYDLRFPVWSKNRYINNNYEYDCILYLANWPGRRNYAWNSLLVARAIENQSYVVGVNRIGQDGNDIPHQGDSAVYNCRGRSLISTVPNEISVKTVKLSYEDIASFRKSFTVGLDWDKFDIVT